jgi:hypothetical protein
MAKKKPEPSFKDKVKKEAVKAGKGIVRDLVIAANFTPVGKAASIVGKFASASKATKITSGAPKVKTRKFTQGDKARITNTPPKSSKAGPNSPIKGTKVEVKYKTKELTPMQQATLTTGRVAREKAKSGLTYAKGAVTGAYVTNEVKNAKAKKKETQALKSATDKKTFTDKKKKDK